MWPPPSNCVKSRFIGIPYTENEMILVVTSGRRPHRSFNSSENICQISSSLAGEKMLKINNVWECLRPPRGVSSHLFRRLKVGLSGTSTRFEAVVLKAAWIKTSTPRWDQLSCWSTWGFFGKTHRFQSGSLQAKKKTDHSKCFKLPVVATFK